MTDAQVVQYAKTANAQGKSKEQIGRELMAKGVSKDQLQRIQSQMANAEAASNGAVETTASDSHDALVRATQEQSVSAMDSTAVSDIQPIRVYGQGLFRDRNLTFEPNENLATPQDYRLGPGDEVVIDIWGNNEDHIRLSISPEGRIMVSQIGPIYLNGLTIREANNLVKDMFASKYADVAGSGSDISLTLGQVRTIQVDIMGEVATPGTYRISPFSTLFHALYRAGGTTDAGSLRSIEVIRNGRKVSSSDLYDYIFKGKKSTDVRLQEGDVIIVPSYERIVTIDGEIKRPMAYEIKRGETLADLLEYAGGFTANAFTERVNVDRVSNGTHNMAIVDEVDFNTTRLDDGDVVTVGGALKRYDNRVEVRGSVFRPGYYALGTEVGTLSELIKRADGLTEDAFMNRAQLFREKDDLTTELVSVDLAAILAGTANDIELKKNDVLVIASVKEIEPKADVTIDGEINVPGSYPYADHLTVEDLVLMAGGFAPGASEVRINVSRRVIDPEATTLGEMIAEVYTLNAKNGLVVDGNQGFELEPFDIVDVRRSPGYEPQRRVHIYGEVPFYGAYTLERRAERMSDLVKRAGGVGANAYIKGAHLTRQLSEDEKAARDEALKLAMQSSGSDSISIAKVTMGDTYKVGINLEAALANPGGPEDVVLKVGDHLFIPEMVSTVKISGDVLFPNTVAYTPNKKLKHYITQAGGYGSQANKGKAFVVYMNGTVARGKNAPIEPGCQIIVPSKQQGHKISLAEWLAIGTSAASLGTTAAAITNLIK
ncbi:MAG: SLBB domain-containing protein [Muribaculaceae bacterium]|nr:SLBB domain-containing protein [Muribaculaceae bacterium]